MGKICLQCGDKGSSNAFVYCVKCLKFVVHRYCLDIIPRTMDEIVHWVCGDDCEGVAQKQSVKHDHNRICVSNNVKGTRKKIVLHRDGPKKPHDACTKSDPDKKANEHVTMQEGVKNNDDLPILLPGDKKCIFSLEAKKEDNLLGRKRLLLNGGPEKIKKKKKTTIIIQPSTRNDEHGLENIVPSKNESEEGVIKLRHDTKSTSEGENGQKWVSIRSSKKKKKKKKKKKTAISSKEINFSCEQNYSLSQVQVRNNRELGVYNNDLCGDFPKDLHVSSAEPVAMPIWRGSFDILDGKGNVLNGLLGHLSTLACQKVFEEACQFQPLLRLEMLPKSDVWPKSFEKCEPRGDNIALYFFPSKSSERDFDRLVEEMMHKELALKAVVQNAELLVFDSTELPLLYWNFLGKYYLWEVFRQKQRHFQILNCGRKQTTETG